MFETYASKPIQLSALFSQNNLSIVNNKKTKYYYIGEAKSRVKNNCIHRKKKFKYRGNTKY